MLDGRIMHNGNLIPPLLLGPIVRTPRVRVRRRRRLDDVADEFGVSAAFRGDGGEALSYIDSCQIKCDKKKSYNMESWGLHTCPYLK
jgi:hypothetical protein